MSAGADLKPLSLRREGDGLAIDWRDGAQTFVTWAKLRKNCPCASCNEDRQKPPDPFKLLSDKELTAGAPQPAKMRPAATTPTRSPGTTATTPASTRWNCSATSSEPEVSPRNTHATRSAADSLPRRPAHHRRRQRQGRRRQVDRRRQPRPGPPACTASGSACMDADIYGPSVPIMMGLGHVDPQTTPLPAREVRPEAHVDGLPASTPDKARHLRGPMVAQVR